MKKRLVSLLCALILLLGLVPSAAALEGEAQQAAITLTELHLIGGVPAEKALRTAATRRQATELLVSLYGVTPSDREVSPQEYAVAKGWVTVTDGQQEAIPTGEICASLLRQLGYEGFTEEDAALYARRIGLTARDYEETLTLGELYELARDALTFPGADGVTLAEHLVQEGICTQAEIQGLFPETLTARQVADRHMAAAFSLDIYATEDHYKKDRVDGGGSGFFISADGLAVTNCHSLEQAIHANAILVTGERFPVERVLFYDPDMDLALLRVSRTTVDNKTTVPAFAYLEIAEEPDLRPGDKVYALGVPLGVTLTISEGVVSAVNHKVSRFSTLSTLNTADISHGSSGGALLNVYGHVVGITTGAYEGGNSLYISLPVTPLLEVDQTVEGITLAEYWEEMLAR